MTYQNNTNITCPNCNHNFSPSEEWQKKREEELDKKFAEKSAEQSQKIKQAQADIAKKSEKLAEEQANQEKLFAEKLLEEKKKLWSLAQEKAEEKILQEQAVKFKALEEQNADTKKQLEKSQQQELEFIKQKRELEEKQKNFELELQRKLEKERKEVEDKVKKSSDEEHRMKMMEKEKQLNMLQKTIEDLKRKSEQGSMQIQGEVKENDLKSLLEENFTTDQIEDVPTGIRGADLVQNIRDNFGQKSGVILWEVKNTKVWNKSWLQKLKDDQASIGADICILVSQSLPEDVTHYSYVEGVWVVSFNYALPLVSTLRYHLTEMNKTKQSLQNQDEKMQVLFQYLSSPQFKNRIENIVSAFDTMKEDLTKEKRAFQRIWQKREKELERVSLNTSGFYGDLQGLMGAALPTVDALMLDEGL